MIHSSCSFIFLNHLEIPHLTSEYFSSFKARLPSHLAVLTAIHWRSPYNLPTVERTNSTALPRNSDRRVYISLIQLPCESFLISDLSSSFYNKYFSWNWRSDEPAVQLNEQCFCRKRRWQPTFLMHVHHFTSCTKCEILHSENFYRSCGK